MIVCPKCGSKRMVWYRCDADWAGEVSRCNDDNCYDDGDYEDGDGYDMEATICLSCKHIY